MRVAEMGQVHRHELSGALHGLMRVRTFTQDDAHIFMLPEQIKSEIVGVIDFIDYVYNIFGFKYHIELSTRRKILWELRKNGKWLQCAERSFGWKRNSFYHQRGRWCILRS